MLKRIFLFMLVNILVMTTVTFVLSLFGVHGYLNQYGIDYGQLAIFCLVWGMAGSVISLLLSKVMAKFLMRVQVIDPNTHDPALSQLVATVHNFARAANLPKMPEVGIYDSPELNAFATGPTKSNSLVAVSSGLLGHMNKKELEGVLAHEISHIANGDMVTMTLLQGIINAFVMFLSRVLAFAISQALGNREGGKRESNYFMQSILVMVLQIVFSMLGMIVVAWFSRKREYRADAGGAKLAGRESMIAALESLHKGISRFSREDAVETPPSMRAFQISSGRGKGMMDFFSTHPPIEERIEALSKMTY